MNKKDMELVEIAKNIKPVDLEVIDNLIELAESEEAEKELKYIRQSKYHKEELDNNNL